MAEFQTWASYAHPTPGVKVAQLAEWQIALRQTMAGLIVTAGAASAAAAAVATSMVVRTSLTMAQAFATGVMGSFAAARGISDVAMMALGAMPAAAGAAIVVSAAVILATAAWQMAEDLDIPKQIAARADEAETLTDVFAIEELKPHYASLSFEDRELPSDPALHPLHHSPDFQSLLVNRVMEWTMFDDRGNFIPDPVGGYEGTPDPADTKFRIGTSDNHDFVEVKAPEGIRDADDRPIEAFRVLVSRGWLMVSPRVDGQWGAAQPQLSVPYLMHTPAPTSPSRCRRMACRDMPT